MDQVYVHFTKKSSNSKTGPIPTTTSSRNTCPKSCPLRDGGGCYAQAGYYTRLHWDKVSAGTRGGPLPKLYENLRKLPTGTLWRHNVAGDLPSTADIIDAQSLEMLIAGNEGHRGFTYTHHDVSIAENQRLIRKANANGFTINLSSNNCTHADELYALGIGPVVTIVPENQLENFTTPGGNPVVICPAVTRNNVTCATCKMCAIPDRKTIIGFPAHGAARKKIPL